jgi:hypothetical protein
MVAWDKYAECQLSIIDKNTSIQIKIVNILFQSSWIIILKILTNKMQTPSQIVQFVIDESTSNAIWFLGFFFKFAIHTPGFPNCPFTT